MRHSLLYASPFPPIKSGISEYSENLIQGLREYFDVTLLIDSYELQNKKLYQDFEVLTYRKDKVDFAKFDYKIYNMGNNSAGHSYIYECAIRYPGATILHDFVLYHLVMAYYQNKKNFYSKMFELESAYGIHLLKQQFKKGYQNFLACFKICHLLPLNKELLQISSSILVHSEYTKGAISAIPGMIEKAHKIELADCAECTILPKKELFQKFGLPEDKILLTSFGFIFEHKMLHLICEVIQNIPREDICFVMVGEGNYVDQYVDCKKIYKTGYTTLEEFQSMIFYSDLSINLRNPSMGETSAAVVKILCMGKACIVSDVAWFSELPSDAVLKINNGNVKEELRKGILSFLNDRDNFPHMTASTQKAFQEKHSKHTIAKDIFSLLTREGKRG